MGGYAGGHPHRDARRPVDQQVRELGRKYHGFLEGTVVVGNEIDRFLLDIMDHFLGQFIETGFGVSHGGRGVPVHGPEVALPVDEGVAEGKILCHPHHGVIDGLIPVRVILAHDISHDTGGLPVRAVRGHTGFVHPVQDTPVHRLETVTDIRQCPADDDGHGIVEVGLFHLVLHVPLDDLSHGIPQGGLPAASPAALNGTTIRPAFTPGFPGAPLTVTFPGSIPTFGHSGPFGPLRVVFSGGTGAQRWMISVIFPGLLGWILPGVVFRSLMGDFGGLWLQNVHRAQLTDFGIYWYHKAIRF